MADMQCCRNQWECQLDDDISTFLASMALDESEEETVEEVSDWEDEEATEVEAEDKKASLPPPLLPNARVCVHHQHKGVSSIGKWSWRSLLLIAWVLCCRLSCLLAPCTMRKASLLESIWMIRWARTMVLSKVFGILTVRHPMGSWFDHKTFRLSRRSGENQCTESYWS